MVVQFIGTIVLARLLSPDAFGLLAMVTVLMGIGSLIRDFGMGTASLQEKSLSQAQASNLFWVNAALSGGTAVALACATPLVVSVYGDSRLLRLVPAMALVLLITGLQTQYQARLAREMQFTKLAVATFTSAAVGIASGVTGALLGWDYWALVAQKSAAATWMLTFYLISSRWLPSLPSRAQGSLTHVRAGTDYGLANVLGYVADNIDTFMIGVRWGSIDLGYYNRAFQLFMQPISAVFGPLTWVVIPTINQSTSEGRDSESVLLRVQSALAGASTWVLLATAATADWLIPLLLGDQWAPLVPILQILAIAGVFKALSQINYWAYIVAKQPRQLLLSNLVTKPIQILLIVGASALGIEWVALAYAIGRALSWPINLIWLARTTGQRSRAMLGNGIRIVVAAAVAYYATRLVLVSLLHVPAIWMVVIGAIISTIIYFAMFVLSPGGKQEMSGIFGFARQVIGRPHGSTEDENHAPE